MRQGQGDAPPGIGLSDLDDRRRAPPPVEAEPSRQVPRRQIAERIHGHDEHEEHRLDRRVPVFIRSDRIGADDDDGNRRNARFDLRRPYPDPARP
jgi:hypothetical protein